MGAGIEPILGLNNLCEMPGEWILKSNKLKLARGPNTPRTQKKKNALVRNFILSYSEIALLANGRRRGLARE